MVTKIGNPLTVPPDRCVVTKNPKDTLKAQGRRARSGRQIITRYCQRNTNAHRGRDLRKEGVDRPILSISNSEHTEKPKNARTDVDRAFSILGNDCEL